MINIQKWIVTFTCNDRVNGMSVRKRNSFYIDAIIAENLLKTLTEHRFDAFVEYNLTHLFL